MKKAILKHKYFFILFLLLTFHLVNNYFWIKQDSESLGFDVPHHIKIVLSLCEQFKSLNFYDFGLKEKIGLVGSLFSRDIVEWPRLVHFTTALAVLPLKDILFHIRFFNIFYLAILVISVYLIGKKIGGRNVGLLSAYLISFYPCMFGLSRKFGLDFPLSAAVSVIIYFLLCCDEFQNRRNSILLGVTLGLGILVKGAAVFFIVGPFIYILIISLINKRNRFNSFINIVFALGLAFFISLVWWKDVFSQKGVHITKSWLSAQTVHGTANRLFFYLTATYFNVSALFFIMFLIGLFYYSKLLNKKNEFFILFWFLSAYCVLSGLGNMQFRYILPALAPLAIITSVGWIGAPLNKNKKTTWLSLFIVLGVLQFFVVSYYKPLPYFTDIQWGHPPIKNNHKLIVENFNKLILAGSLSVVKEIAIVETKYFRGDKCVRLGYFFTILGNENKVSISAGGFLPPKITNKFLSNAANYNYLIGFSKFKNGPDFSDLLLTTDNEDKALAEAALKKFQKFKVLSSATLFPEGIGIYLLENKERF